MSHRNVFIFQQAATIPGALLGLAGGVLYFGTRDADPLKPIMVRVMYHWTTSGDSGLFRASTHSSSMVSARSPVSVSFN